MYITNRWKEKFFVEVTVTPLLVVVPLRFPPYHLLFTPSLLILTKVVKTDTYTYSSDLILLDKFYNFIPSLNVQIYYDYFLVTVIVSSPMSLDTKERTEIVIDRTRNSVETCFLDSPIQKGFVSALVNT